MKRYICSFVFFFFGLICSACQSSKNVLKVARLPGYDTKSASHILFLNFRITDRGGGKSELVELLSATPANGKFKLIARGVDAPYQIKVVPRFAVNHLDMPFFLEHPLRRLAEVPEESGNLSRVELKASEGTLQIRLQYEPTLVSLDLYSIAPDQHERKIYTLNLKP